eukprot:TRINITY_DN36355_c0_g1_i2.p1 TRINITY_DN36355_c0_g1~~TRINITY_DN36355_c0_g1_i2.p1  ORF type:complete len:415 (-),score=81.65 TRINITY_DN36355_c0_g1_i2:361-1605(-)
MVEEEAAAHLEWLRAMPKVELHVHLDGALDLALLYELAKQHVEELPEEMTSVASGKVIPVRSLVRKCTSAEDFRALVTCKGERSLLEMIDRFMTFLPVLQGRREAIEAFATKFCERQAAEKVLYTEVRYSPHFLAKEGVMTAKEAVEAVMRGLQCGCAKTGITVNQILCCIGSHPEWADECVELAVQNMRLPTCAVVGFDSAGPEDHLAASPSPFVAAFRKAKDAGLGITMHAGELGGPANVRYAVSEAFGAKRIGHGYAVPKDADLMRELRDRGIHIEACPTSSMETGVRDDSHRRAGFVHDADGPVTRGHHELHRICFGRVFRSGGAEESHPRGVPDALCFVRDGAQEHALSVTTLLDSRSFINKVEARSLRRLTMDWHFHKRQPSSRSCASCRSGSWSASLAFLSDSQTNM